MGLVASGEFKLRYHTGWLYRDLCLRAARVRGRRVPGSPWILEQGGLPAGCSGNSGSKGLLHSWGRSPPETEREGKPQENESP